MAKGGSRDLAIGVMFSLALLILALGVMAVSGESGFLLRRATYDVVFPSADGLVVGAPVRMAGVTIGTVAEIDLPKDPGASGIRARLAIDPDYSERLREDSRATLRILQLLTNEKFVDITPGKSGATLAPGAEIALQEQTGMLERGEVIAEDVSQITISLKNILAQLERGEGLIGQMLNDPEFGKKGLESLGRTLENTERITADLRHGRGLVGRLLYDEALGRRSEELGQAIDDLARAMRAVGGDDAALGALLAKGGLAERAVVELQQAAAGLSRVVARLESDQGLVGKLLHDEEYSAQLAQDLAATVHNLSEITGKINRGEGTLGALINERVLHDAAEEVVAGVNDSKFARWLLRHYQKEGITAAEPPEESKP